VICPNCFEEAPGGLYSSEDHGVSHCGCYYEGNGAKVLYHISRDEEPVSKDLMDELFRCKVTGWAFEGGISDVEEEQLYRITLEPSDSISAVDWAEMSLVVKKEGLTKYPFGANVLLTIGEVKSTSLPLYDVEEV